MVSDTFSSLFFALRIEIILLVAFMFGLRFGLRSKISVGWQKGIGFVLIFAMLITFSFAMYFAYSNGLIRS